MYPVCSRLFFFDQLYGYFLHSESRPAPPAVYRPKRTVNRGQCSVRRSNRSGVGNHTRNELRAVVLVFVHPRAWAIFRGFLAVNRGPWIESAALIWRCTIARGPCLSGHPVDFRDSCCGAQKSRSHVAGTGARTMFFTNICQKFHIMFYLQKNL